MAVPPEKSRQSGPGNWAHIPWSFDLRIGLVLIFIYPYIHCGMSTIGRETQIQPAIEQWCKAPGPLKIRRFQKDCCLSPKQMNELLASATNGCTHTAGYSPMAQPSARPAQMPFLRASPWIKTPSWAWKVVATVIGHADACRQDWNTCGCMSSLKTPGKVASGNVEKSHSQIFII
jgi:hypothetical protein